METLLYESCKQMGVLLEQHQLEQFLNYQNLLLQWNEKMNLTAITDEREVILKHFVDSAAVCVSKNLYEKSVIDVGTGAGFPGIPIKLVNLKANVTLIDSQKKRLNFIENVLSKMEIYDVNIIHMRAEDAGHDPNLREKFDFCMSRAVSQLNILLEYSIPLLKVGGESICLKGPDVTEEINTAKEALKVLKSKILDIKKVNIPYTDITHSIISIKKLGQTPPQYPRRPSKITKSPIK